MRDRLERNAALKAAHTFACAAVGGGCGTFVGHPVDTLKLRIQTRTVPVLNPVNAVLHIMRNEGGLSLYRGLLMPLLSVPIVTGTQFAIYSQLKYKLTGSTSLQSAVPLHTAMLAGLVTGWFLSLVVCPVELIKGQMQVGAISHYRNVRHCVQHLWQQNGFFRGFFSGLPLTMATRSFFAFYFAAYEYVHRLLPRDRFGLLSSIAAGGSAGTAYWLTCFPVDAIKNRVQTSRNQSSPLGAFQIGLKHLKEISLRGAYRGLWPCLLRSFPTSGVSVLAFEFLHSFPRK